jgi:ATP-dependent DNA helicase DinG
VFALLQQGLETASWIYDGKKDDLEVKFKPITVDKIGQQVLWRHGKKWLCMSASLLSSQEMAQSLGWSEDFATVTVPSTFPVANRPVYIRSVANMGSKANSDGSQSLLLMDEIDKIIAEHPSDKILIHTVSYFLARQIAGHINGSLLTPRLSTSPPTHRKVFQYTDGQGRERAVEEWKKDNTPSIMVAPSLDRGVDLPGDLCRVQIIAKIPFPFLGDKQVSARLYGPGGRLWYAVQTVRTMIQMTGRAVRNSEDKAECYVLDASFDDLWGKNKRLFPQWWKDAVIWRK